MERYFDPSFFASLILVTFLFPLTPYPLFLHIGLSSILLSNAKLFRPRGDVYVLPSQCPGPSCEEVPLVEEVPHRDATGETHAQSYVGGRGGCSLCAVTWCHALTSHNVMCCHMVSCVVTWCHGHMQLCIIVYHFAHFRSSS